MKYPQLAFAFLCSTLVLHAQQPAAAAPREVPAVVAAGLNKAKHKNRRVLLVRTDDSEPGKKLLATLKQRKLAMTLLFEFVQVPVGSDELAAQCDLPAAPALAVLDGTGKRLALWSGDELAQWDAAKGNELLGQLKCPQQDAKQVLDAALVQAGKENKRVFVHFGSPT